nr:subunit V of cytochrome b6/f complex [Chara vulgaris]ABA61917.1 subunit V of cytochrome b6/f complex [Chara vulgaris]WAP91331.1 cytochrome b6/f complex subunit V [Chara vulgaris]
MFFYSFVNDTNPDSMLYYNIALSQDLYHSSYLTSNTKKNMVEPLLSGIVLGLIPITLAGLFVTAYLQYRRGDQLNL